MSHAVAKKRWWVLGQFDDTDKLIAAGEKLREQKLGELDAYTPYPVEGLEEALGLPKSKVPFLVLGGGMTGAIVGYSMQVFFNAIDYQTHTGGRPLHSPPLNIPVTFELGVLLGAFGAFFGLFALLRLPRPHHPVFEVPAFVSASVDRYWMSVTTEEGPEHRQKIESELAALGATEVKTVEDVDR